MSKLDELFKQVAAPQPSINLDLRKIGRPFYVDDQDIAWLMYDEIVIGNHKVYKCVVCQFLLDGTVVHTEKVPGHPGFKDDDAIIHLTDIDGKMRLATLTMVPQEVSN